MCHVDLFLKDKIEIQLQGCVFFFNIRMITEA